MRPLGTSLYLYHIHMRTKCYSWVSQGHGGRMSLKSEISISNIKENVENVLGSRGTFLEHMKNFF